jgi:UDP-N-acetylglucosamine:LPS N-acetylglucosamine transferase
MANWLRRANAALSDPGNETVPALMWLGVLAVFIMYTLLLILRGLG